MVLFCTLEFLINALVCLLIFDQFSHQYALIWTSTFIRNSRVQNKTMITTKIYSFQKNIYTVCNLEYMQSQHRFFSESLILQNVFKVYLNLHKCIVYNPITSNMNKNLLKIDIDNWYQSSDFLLLSNILLYRFNFY